KISFQEKICSALKTAQRCATRTRECAACGERREIFALSARSAAVHSSIAYKSPRSAAVHWSAAYTKRDRNDLPMKPRKHRTRMVSIQPLRLSCDANKLENGVLVKSTQNKEVQK